jgi:hypothetical protein
VEVAMNESSRMEMTVMRQLSVRVVVETPALYETDAEPIGT